MARVITKLTVRTADREVSGVLTGDPDVLWELFSDLKASYQGDMNIEFEEIHSAHPLRDVGTRLEA